jgi:NADPH:quinone reductase-like Zn-dependent oxidoreductase
VKALVLTGTGGPDVLRVEERPDPPVGPGEVRIAVRAAGLNFADTMARLGLYPDAPKTPCVLGYEVAGEIESVGAGVTDRQPGERVFAGTHFGGQAELVSVPAEQAFPLPERLSFEQGAAIVVNYSTAYAALVLMGSLREGDRVLIHAAAGGVGIAATQIARNARAEIFGTASGSKHDAIREQGVFHPIDYRSTDFEAEVMRITGEEGVDLIIDALGPTSFRKDYRLLRPGGRLVMYGLSEATKEGKRDLPAVLRSLAKMPLATMPWWKSLTMMNENKGVFGLNMLAWWDREGNLDRAVAPLIRDLEVGSLDPVVAEAFPFERAGDAHMFLGEGRNVGKVVLFPS